MRERSQTGPVAALAALVLVIVLFLWFQSCTKSDPAESGPCVNHSGVVVTRYVFPGKQPSGSYVCGDGVREVWQNGKRTASSAVP